MNMEKVEVCGQNTVIVVNASVCIACSLTVNTGGCTIKRGRVDDRNVVQVQISTRSECLI